MAQLAQLKHELDQQKLDNAHYHARNQALSSEIDALKNGTSIEDRSRRDMGMIRKNETFVLIVDKSNAANEKSD